MLRKAMKEINQEKIKIKRKEIKERKIEEKISHTNKTEFMIKLKNTTKAPIEEMSRIIETQIDLVVSLKSSPVKKEENHKIKEVTTKIIVSNLKNRITILKKISKLNLKTFKIMFMSEERPR